MNDPDAARKIDEYQRHVEALASEIETLKERKRMLPVEKHETDQALADAKKQAQELAKKQSELARAARDVDAQLRTKERESAQIERQLKELQSTLANLQKQR